MHGLHELLLPDELREASALLESRGLDMPENATFGLGMYEEGKLVGTGFLAGDIVCGIGVAAHREGTGVSAAIVTALVHRAFDNGLGTLKLFAKPGEASKFAGLGFSLLASTESAALLELGAPGYSGWVHAVKERLAMHKPLAPYPEAQFSVPLGAIVMNANPFTLGHRYLVKKSLEKCARAAVFVVEEDASAFPFAMRLGLVTQGLADIDRAIVLPGGPYMVSRASFPSYFTGKAKHAEAHARLDCTLFATRIAPDLGIGLRAVGTEPYCEVTAEYNAVMRDMLPQYGIACLEIPRLVTESGEAVSASSVRAALQSGTDEKFASLVPPTTLALITGAQGKNVAEKLRGSTSRH